MKCEREYDYEYEILSISSGHEFGCYIPVFGFRIGFGLISYVAGHTVALIAGSW